MNFDPRVFSPYLLEFSAEVPVRGKWVGSLDRYAVRADQLGNDELEVIGLEDFSGQATFVYKDDRWNIDPESLDYMPGATFDSLQGRVEGVKRFLNVHVLPESHAQDSFDATPTVDQVGSDESEMWITPDRPSTPSVVVPVDLQPGAWIAIFSDVDEAERYAEWRRTVPAPDDGDTTECAAIGCIIDVEGTAFWNSHDPPTNAQTQEKLNQLRRRDTEE